ncbi:MAG: DUF2750 domain-containing protein [Gammaproteobacteria bacterium]|nr:DUF2750 domain-containing protein [Gammaproteobacteria bacterium]MBU2058475.1 DUF2750 domain-containing protein [Gammaproteobacteria bacterium]MBU2176472.1 DUF2750 domain-containing protein [Gammaproteobacteria bacterium]MBU2248586.1 DUF2750 domain-containing protein [Gammaproteobacteria bacterium]MBU2345551.1 DUF2750 domain-containing protein [Gammaproteobacteria bacterium]
MNYELTADDLNKLSLLDAEQRYDYFIQAVADLEKIWILVDEEGFVLVDADEERCIPVWPHAELAQLWINGDWAECQAQAVDIATWLDKWTAGLGGDELAIAVFPHAAEPGVVIGPEEFSETLIEATQDNE